MTSLTFDHRPPAMHMIQRVTHSQPGVSITAPAQEQIGTAFDIVSESNRQSYVSQSAQTRGGIVADFVRL